MTLGPELVHDDPVRHVHERESNRRFGAFGGRGQGIHKRQREGNAHSFQEAAAINNGRMMIGIHISALLDVIVVHSSTAR